MNANLGWGLNARSNKRNKIITGFSGGDESSDDDAAAAAAPSDHPIKSATNARSAVNREIAAEQAALRQRAEAAMMAASSANSNVYDYDAEYESFSSEKKKQKQDELAAAAATSADSKKDAKPRYITNLLKTAQRRNQEHEIIYERKIAKEQQELDDNLQYEGKEKFITSSYRQKLAEREQWAKEEEERTKREEEEEQKNAAKNKMGVGSFMFGAIGRNLLTMKSGDGSRNDDDNNDGNAGTEHDHERMKSDYQCQESTGENNDRTWNASKEKRYPQGGDGDSSTIRNRRSHSLLTAEGGNDEATTNNVVNATDPDCSRAGGGGVRSRQQMLEERAIKIRAARERYFKRREGGFALQ